MKSKKLNLNDFKTSAVEAVFKSSIMGGEDEGYETSFTKCTWSLLSGSPYDEDDYGDWISTC